MESVELKHQDSEVEKSWIEREFEKRECACFIPSGKDRHRCGCGRLNEQHKFAADSASHGYVAGEKWCPNVHTVISNTDAYGTVEFQGGPQPTKAQYVRLSYDTKPDQVLQLLQKQWNLELPKLLISVHGGIANFELQPKLRRVFRKGLLKAAKTTGAWIVSAGINTGVVRHVGDALGDTLVQARNHIVTLGIAPWGVVHNRNDLIGLDMVTPYHSVAANSANSVVLNSNHSYFLLVDNGSAGKYGCEFMLRKKLEKHIQRQKFATRNETKNHSTPVVCLILEGGTNTIRTVLECITDTPPVPVVICDGSGRAADLLAFTHKYAQEDGTMPETLRDQLIQTIEKTFQYNREQAEKLFIELMLCVKKKELITVFRMGEESEDIDLAILTALLKAQNASAADQLSLALAWNRVDVAKSHIFVYGQAWPEGTLDQAMMDALVYDRVDFVELLLQNGVSMQKWLTISRLEELFNIKQDPGCTLRYLIKHTHGYSLYDIGSVIEQLMGGAYRASFCRKPFRRIYTAVMKKSATTSSLPGAAMANAIDRSKTSAPIQVFRYPYHELMIWAVLLKRQNMAKFMWQHGEEALAKALVACKLYKSMGREAAQDDLEIDIYEEFKGYANEFAQLALDLLEQCYKNDDDLTLQLLTYELDHWSDQTCLSLAVSANHRELIAHTCCQTLLTEMWMAALRMRKYTGLKVVMGILFFPFVLCLEFKSKEELQLMPQTMEEHLQEIDSDSDSDDSSVSSKDMSVCPSEHTPNPARFAAPNGTVLLNNISNSIHETSKKSSLRFGKKIYEFYTAPITKFYTHTMGYLAFLMMMTYIVLIKMPPFPSWQEWFVIAYMFTFFIEKVRELLVSEPKKLVMKLHMFYSEVWNITDTIAIVLFLVGVLFRFSPLLPGYGKVFYCMDIVFWYIRLLDIMSVSKSLGPYVTMIGKMMKDLLNFVVILLIVLMAFGIVRQAITYPDEEPSWQLAKFIFFKPYFMLYGEVYAPEIDPECSDDEGSEFKCVPGRWFVPAAMTAFLIVANILLLNLLIAVFNNTFHQVNRISKQVWKFQRYILVIEYECKPILPPPFIILCHVYMLVRFFIRRCMKKDYHFDNGLKLFLEPDEVEKLHDFEEEAMQDLYRMKDVRYKSSADERIRVTTERVENMSLRLDDINQKENGMRLSLQTLDYRMAKLEELTIQGLDSISKLHETMLQFQRGNHHHYKRRRDRTESATKPLYIHIPPERSPLFEPKSVISWQKRKKQKKNEDRLRPFTDYNKPYGGRPHYMKSQSWESPGALLDRDDIPQKKMKNDLASRTDKVKSVKFRESVETDESSPAEVEFPCYEKPKFSFASAGTPRVKDEFKEDRHTPGRTCRCSQSEPEAGEMTLPCAQSTGNLKPQSLRGSSSENLYESFENAGSNPRNNLSVQLALQGMTIVTPIRSEYTTITDDIDTACLNHPSPGGSPVTPHKSFFDLYIPSDDKPPAKLLTKSSNFRLSEAEQLKHAEESEHAQMEPMIRKRMRHISLTDADSLGNIAKHVVNELTTSSDSSDSSTSSQQSVYSENDGVESPDPRAKKGLKHVKSEPAFHLQPVMVKDPRLLVNGDTTAGNSPGAGANEEAGVAFVSDGGLSAKKKRVSYLEDIAESVA